MEIYSPKGWHYCLSLALSFKDVLSKNYCFRILDFNSQTTTVQTVSSVHWSYKILIGITPKPS